MTDAERLAAQLQALAEAAIAYDLAILACANDPSKMATATTAEGEDLDTLYDRLMARARLALGVTHPVVPMQDDALARQVGGLLLEAEES